LIRKVVEKSVFFLLKLKGKTTTYQYAVWINFVLLF